MGQNFQLDQIVVDGVKKRFGNVVRQELGTFLDILDDRLIYPGKVEFNSVSGTSAMLKVFGSPLQHVVGATANSVTGAYYDALSSVSGVFNSYPDSYLDLSTGGVTGAISVGSVPTTNSGDWRWLLLYANSTSGSFGVSFGTASGSEPAFGTNMPSKPTGATELCAIKVQAASTGTWVFGAPSVGSLVNFTRGGGGGAGGGGSITVEEVSGTTSILATTKIKVPDGSLTDLGGGVALFDFGTQKSVDDSVSGITGTTVTFANQVYGYNKGAQFFRNGIDMLKVSTFGGGSNEYQEVNNGNASNQITLSPATPAISSDLFQMKYFVNTFNGQGLAEKNDFIARGFADGSQTQGCSISTVSLKTRLIVSGWTYNLGRNSGKTQGELTVRYNGQDIERKVVGINDNVGNIVYDEVNGSTVDVYTIIAGPSTAPLGAGLPLEVIKTSYFVSQLDAISSDMIPAASGYTLGTPTNPWAEGYFGPSSVYIGPDGAKIFYDITTQQLKFKHTDAGTAAAFNEGGGGGGVGADLGATLAAFEADTLNFQSQNVIVDDFNDTEMGAKFQTIQSADALRFSGSNVSGTYERIREQSIIAASADADVVYSLQAYGPDNTAVSGNAFLISGNVSGDFPVASKVMVAKSIVSDGKRVHIHVKESGGNIALLPVASVSYNNGADKTTVTLTNTGGLDLDLDVAAADYKEKLRLIPFDHTTEIKSKTSAPYVVMDVVEGQARETIRISGEQYFRTLFGIAGSITDMATEMSKDGVYGVMIIRAETAGNSVYHYGYSVNRGRSWTKTSDTRDVGNDQNDENTQFARGVRGQLAVANNGKAVWTWYNASASGEIRGAFADLTLAPTTVTDIVLNGGTDGGSVTGKIFVSASEHTGYLSIDPVDCSLIAVAGKKSTGTAAVKTYTWAGAAPVYLNTSGTVPVAYFRNFCMAMTGTSGAHRVHLLAAEGASFNARYLDETSPTTLNSYSVAPASASAGAGSTIPISLKANGTYLVAHIMDQASPFEVYFDYLLLSGTSWTGSRKDLFNHSDLQMDTFIGYSSGSTNNLPKINNHTMLFNPSDDKHVYFVSDVRAASGTGVAYPLLFEIKDLTTFQGSHQNSTSTAGEENIKGGASTQQIGQVFTANANRYRSFGFKFRQFGVVPAGATITAKLYNTSGSLPTGAALYTSQSIDVARINSASSTANSQWVYFNFDNVSLTNAVVYAIVVETANFPTSGTNFLGYSTAAGSGAIRSDGTTWSTIAATTMNYDFNGEWIRDVGNMTGSTLSNKNINEDNMESQLSLIDSSNFQFCTRKTKPYNNASSYYPYSGHVYRRVIAMATGGTAQSTIGAIKIASYNPNAFDENLVVNISLGGDDSRNLNRVDGTDANNPIADRSGLNFPVSSVTTSTAVVDSSFQSGKCLDFNGSTHYILYNGFTYLDLYSNKAFCIEFEIKPDDVTLSSRIIACTYNASAQGGFELYGKDTSNGDIAFSIRNSAATVIGRAQTAGGFLSNATYSVVRITGDGAGGPIRIYKATSPTGTFTEATYAGTQTSFASGNTAGITFGLTVGRFPSGTQYFDGRLGYFKFAQGSSSFSHALGFKNQAPTVSFQAQNGFVSMKQGMGTNGAADVNYYDEGIAFQDVARVDSYDQEFKLSASIDTADQGNVLHVKETLKRGSVNNISALEGIIVQFSKA